MADGKIFAAEFALRRNVKAQDKILIEDSDDGVVKYAFPPQIAALSGYAYADSIAGLPEDPVNKTIGYVVGDKFYIYVGEGGNAKDGLYQEVQGFVGPQGIPGPKGDKGDAGDGAIDEAYLANYLQQNQYQTASDVNSALAIYATQAYVTQEIDKLLGGASGAYDTLKEIEEVLKGNVDSIGDLFEVLDTKWTQDNTLIAHWNEAYSWGDHATAGYVAKTYVDSNFVTLATAQTITGEKNFTGGFKVNGGVLEYNASLGTWVLIGNLLVTGGVSAFSNIGGFTPSTITDAVLIDNETIKRNSVGALYVASGSDDGGIDEAYLAEYLTANNYAKKSDINSALTDYATQSWVTGKGYFLASNFTKANIKSTLGISNWALASAKPTYAYSEISGTPTSLKNPNALSWSGYSSGSYDGSTAQSIALPTKLSQLTDDVVSGKYLPITGGTISGSGGELFCIDRSDGNPVISFRYNESIMGRLGFDTLGNPKAQVNGVYYDIVHSGNVGDYALPITGGTVKGQIISDAVENFIAKGSTYSLYFGIDAGQVNRGIYDLTLNKWWIVRGADATTTINASIIAEGLRINQSAFDNGLILNRTAANSGVSIVAMSNDVRLGAFGINGTKTFEISGDNGIVAQVSTVTGEATLNGMTTIKHGGNTPLVINQTYATNNSRGVVLMNGSMANGHMYYSHLFGKAASSKNSAYIGFYNAGAGSDSNYLSMGLYGVNNVLNITAAGNVGIGTTSPSQKLYVAGNILATGGVTATNSSDERLKRHLRKFNASKVLMSLGGVYEYEYIDSEVAKNHIYEGTHYGLIYQHVKGTTLDVMCHEREDGFGTLNYIHPKFISLIAGATMENISEVEKLKRKIRHLEAKVKQLENRA